MLIDDITIKVVAGNGGDGAVAFNKAKMALGPTGASGGRGGDVYVEGVSDLGALTRLRHAKVFKAGNGGKGGSQFNDGTAGEDLIIAVPVGTVVHNIDAERDVEITQIGEKVLVAVGGKGGKGNFHYRSSTNTSPQQFQEGMAGEKFTVRLELKLIADVGLIGLPNAGKSSLINELTRAKSKVANYAFTTLEPNLGTYYDLIIADIPGIIEGASGGKGLGIKFLRHVERTQILFHLISAESADPIPDYEIIRKELSQYNPVMLEKKEHIFISKTDMVSPGQLQKLLDALKHYSPDVTPISIHDLESMEKVKKILNQIADQKTAK